MNKDIYIPGDSIRLRPMTEADLPLRVTWFNDPEVRKTLTVSERFELEKTRTWFNAVQQDPSRVDLIIETQDRRPIGVIGFVHIDSVHKTAEIFLVVGEKDYWGKGVMFAAESLLMEWAFSQLGLEKIWAQADTDNVASLITMKKLGFQVEGTLRKEVIQDGRRIDKLRLGLLKEEFKPVVRSEKRPL